MKSNDIICKILVLNLVLIISAVMSLRPFHVTSVENATCQAKLVSFVEEHGIIVSSIRANSLVLTYPETRQHKGQ